jgi:predicted metalloprotease with PDZ domain
MIRDASNNQGTLDDVMRRLYNRTYKQGRGFTAADWWDEVSRAARGKSFADFARRYVNGREPLPLASVLELAGLSYVSDTVREPRLGIATATDSGGVRITQIAPTGAAAIAGARLQDRIVSIGDIPISGDDSFEKFRAQYSGTAVSTLPLVVRRGSETLTLQLPVRLNERPRTRVVPTPNASAKALQVRNGILTGTPRPGGGP